MGGWGCPHDANGECQHVPGKRCDPGMKGCVLYGRVRFSVEAKNSPRIRRQAAAEGPGATRLRDRRD
jgi:hypothetical protein